ncbi:MAG: dTDP-4-dehydrorhamnose reductase [Pirellulales bacterium]
MTRIVVTGAAGQLGAEFCRRLGERAISADRPDADITSDAFVRLLRETSPAAVINAAAFTDVDGAESQPELCDAINATAVERMVEVCRELDCPLVQLSTDYVFGQGDPVRRTPWRESDTPAPQGVYARSKLAAERHAARWERHYVVRTCGLYAHPAPGQQVRNFVQTMLRLGSERRELSVVADQHCTPSYVPHVAAAILFLIETHAYGTYHVVNSGATSWYEFAQAIFRRAGLEVDVRPITSAQFGAVAPRPAYSVLDTTKYHALDGPRLPDWQEGLAAYFLQRKRQPA